MEDAGICFTFATCVSYLDLISQIPAPSFVQDARSNGLDELANEH